MLQQPHSKSLYPQTPHNARNNVQAIKFQFYKFLKIYSIYNILLQTIFWTAPHFLTLDVTVPNTINTHEFYPSIIPGSKFKIASQYFAVNLWLYKNSCQLLFYFTRCFACTAIPTVSFKNPPKTNYCCFGTSTASPWAKATFLYMYLF